MAGSNERRAQVVGRVLAVWAVLVIPQAAAAADRPDVRVTRPGGGRIVLTVADDTVAVRKDIATDRSVVTITTSTDSLILTVRRGVLTVSGPGGMIATAGAGTADDDRLLAVLQRSEVADRARQLLARVAASPDTFVGQSLLLTQSILEVGSGSATALTQHQRWVSGRAAALAARPGLAQGRPTVFRAAWSDAVQDRTPGECWDIYSKEALRIADDFSECTDDLRWYEAHKWAGCSLIYTIRAEAAMAWFISCSGGVPFSG